MGGVILSHGSQHALVRVNAEVECRVTDGFTGHTAVEHY